MRRIWKIAKLALAAAAALALLIPCLAHAHAQAQAGGSPAKAPKPDLHAGGAKPSSIPNDAVTVVSLPGFHLTGAQLETGSICSVVSYQVVSDNEIKMKIKGMRTVEDKDDPCSIKVRTPGGTASTWIVVELTDAQQQQQAAHQKSGEMSKGQAFLNRAGKTWKLSFADGSSETYSSTGANEDGMPSFRNKAGSAVKIAVANDDSVTIIEPGCMRTGKMAGAQVKGGQSQGECTPTGAWTATVDR